MGFLREATNLVRLYSADISRQAAITVAHLERMERLVELHLGFKLESLYMLDVGAGQRLVQMRYFSARGNDVVGVDRDLIVQGFDLLSYLRMARSNGARRAIKTLGRKALGIDARFAAEFDRQSGGTVPEGARLEVMQMNAGDLRFPSESFDFAYSSSVMQYLDDPAAALHEMARVVKPGGGVYVDFMPFTGPNGGLDIRILGGRDAFPRWAHLRPGTAELMQENAPLNRLRLTEWRAIFADAMQGHTFVLDQPDSRELEREARVAQANGELREYSVEELLTAGVSVVWRKPSLSE